MDDKAPEDSVPTTAEASISTISMNGGKYSVTQIAGRYFSAIGTPNTRQTTTLILKKRDWKDMKREYEEN